MRPQLAVLLFAFGLPLFAEDTRIREGIALDDAGKYDDAIARYKAVLADEPANVLAAYELALTYQTKRDAAQCLAVAEPLAENPANPYRVQSLVTYANCLDIGGQSDKAVTTYRRALAIAPDDAGLHYNFGVTLFTRNDFAEAREVLKKAATLRPAHVRTHYLLGKVFQAEQFRVPALLEYLRLLALTTDGDLAKDAAAQVVALLNIGVEATSPKKITVTIDPNSRKEEGDFAVLETMLALAGGTRFLDENVRKSEFERAQAQLATALAMFSEGAADAGASYTASTNLPLVVKLGKNELLEAFAGRALLPLHLDGSDRWQKKNAKALAKLQAFLAE